MPPRAIVAAALLSLALPCGAEVYRCEIDGVTTFSDRPCGERSTRHAESGNVSFIAPDENLPALGEAAQAFIRQRREQLARRNQPPEASPTDPGQAPRKRVETVYVPWPSSGPFDALGGQRVDQRVGNGKRPSNPGQERYSPLNGPILGTRRDSAAFERRNNADRRGSDRQRDQ